MTCKSQASMIGKEAQFSFQREKHKFVSLVNKHICVSWLPQNQTNITKRFLYFQKEQIVVRPEAHSRWSKERSPAWHLWMSCSLSHRKVWNKMQGPPQETPVSVSWGKEEILDQDLVPLFCVLFFYNFGFSRISCCLFPTFSIMHYTYFFVKMFKKQLEGSSRLHFCYSIEHRVPLLPGQMSCCQHWGD